MCLIFQLSFFPFSESIESFLVEQEFFVFAFQNCKWKGGSGADGEWRLGTDEGSSSGAGRGGRRDTIIEKIGCVGVRYCYMISCIMDQR